MKTMAILYATLLAIAAAAATGCQPKTAPDKPAQAAREEPNDVNAVVDAAVARGADIPRSKRNLVIRMLRLNEKDLILGLRTFADLSGGRYPTSLDTRSTLKQVETDRLGASMPDLSRSQKERMVQDIFFACAFYEKLQREGRNVQYHGDAVCRQDAGRILMCWAESKGRHRVLLGDLSIRTASSQQRAELEQ